MAILKKKKKAEPVATVTVAESVAEVAKVVEAPKSEALPKKVAPVKVSVAGRSAPKKGDAFNPAAIAQRAWEIWHNEGCPDGRDLEHWLQAEKELGL